MFEKIFYGASYSLHYLSFISLTLLYMSSIHGHSTNVTNVTPEKITTLLTLGMLALLLACWRLLLAK